MRVCSQGILGFLLMVSLGGAGCEPVPGSPTVFDDAFSLEREILLQDDPESPVADPGVVVRWGERLVILDGILANVKVFDVDGALLRTIGGRGEGPGEFGSPVDAAVLDDHSLAVLDRVRNRVIVFDSSGVLVNEWSTPPGRFSSLDVTPEGLFVLGGFAAGESSTEYGVRLLTPEGNVARSVRPRLREWEFGERTFSTVPVLMQGTVLISFESTSNEGHFLDLETGEEWGAHVGPGVYRAIDWSDPEIRAQSMDAATEWYREQMWLFRASAVCEDRILIQFVGELESSGEWGFTYVLTDDRGSTLVEFETETNNQIQYADERGLIGVRIDDTGQLWLREYSVR